MSKGIADENWEQVRKIFDDALRQKPEERQKFVHQACGRNKTLKAEVESLLASLDSAESFLETPAVIKVAEEVLTKENQFQSGQILAHYEIVEQIGAGGMGEVYLARDTKLNRRVAIKVLRENLLSDEQANRRLLREARAAALLEHPNICAIYEVSESAECSFIVMQYASGETLAEVLKKARLSIKNALDLAIQIADALTEAHSNGIIHRDIKPANIIINDKNQVKILDFGLAKFIEAESSKETTQRFQSSGAVMGTVPFMSPEQLRGKRLDARTDIFSFGAMFYEMIAGRQAFARENNAETISAILNDEPDFSLIPSNLQPILSKSLMKNKDLRYKSAKDLADDLRELQKNDELDETMSEVSTLPNEQVETDEAGQTKSRRFYFWQSSKEKIHVAPETGETEIAQTAESKTTRRNYSPLLLGFTMFSLLGAAVLFYWQFKKVDDLHSFDNLRSVRLVSWKTAASSIYNDYHVSHDGKMVAYSSTQEGPPEGIFVKQTTDGAEIRVTKDEWNNVTPIWSPDDQKIAFASQRENQTGIYSIPAFGGVAVSLKIIDQFKDIRLRYWSTDGAAIFYELEGNLFRLDIATQQTVQITKLDSPKVITRYFSISPDEEKIVYVEKTDGQTDLWMSAINDGSPVRLTNDKEAEIQPRWHPDGKRILYTVNRNNYNQINVAYTDQSTPRQVTRGDSEYKMIDVSSDGTKIYYLAQEKKSDIWGVKTDSGEEFEIASGIESEFWADVSPNGQSVTYQSNIIAEPIAFFGNPLIIVKSLSNKYPPLSVKGINPRWLPDNRRIAFMRRDETEQKVNLWLVNTINGEEKQITNSNVNLPGYSLLPYNRNQTGEYSWSPDSGKVAYVAKESDFRNIFQTSTESGETVNLTNNTNSNVFYFCPLFSPDGKRIAFMSQHKSNSNEEKRVWKIWIVEQDGAKEIYSTTASLRLLGWTADGEIVLEKTDLLMSAIPLDITVLRLSTTGQKQSETIFKNIYVTSMSLSADGKTVVFTARQDNKDNICTASTSGGEVKKITSNGNSKLFYGSPALSPDGKTIFFDKQEETSIISRLENFN